MNNEKRSQEILESILSMLFATYKSGLIKKKDEDGLTFLPRNVLVYIERNNGCRIRDIMKHLSITAPVLTMMVEKLVQKKFITREVNEKERRAMFLAATTKGRDIAAKYHAKQVKMIAAMLEKNNYSEKQKECMATGLKAVIEMLLKV